jgi:hypothetical protein
MLASTPLLSTLLRLSIQWMGGKKDSIYYLAVTDDDWVPIRNASNFAAGRLLAWKVWNCVLQRTRIDQRDIIIYSFVAILLALRLLLSRGTAVNILLLRLNEFSKRLLITSRMRNCIYTVFSLLPGWRNSNQSEARTLWLGARFWIFGATAHPRIDDAIAITVSDDFGRL